MEYSVNDSFISTFRQDKLAECFKLNTAGYLDLGELAGVVFHGADNLVT